jgi:ribosomal protein L16 Arg81 hydroxylase
MRADRALFERLIQPFSVEDFFRDYWEKKVLYIPRDEPRYYDDILSFNDVNAYLSRTDIRYPHVRLVNQGTELPLADYSYDYTYGENVFQGTIDMDKLFHIYSNGATISFQLLQQSIAKLSRFSNSIERFLRFPTQTNLFLTPPTSQGFTAHYDTHSFFILHLYGSKTWKLYDDPYKLPLLRHREYDSDVDLADGPVHEITLRAGELMYVPRGVYHEALTSTETALQITLGIFPYTWVDILQKAIDDLADRNVELRKAPRNYADHVPDDPDVQEGFGQILGILEDESDVAAIIKEMIARTHSRQIVDAENRLDDLQLLEGAGPDTVYVRRDIHATLHRSNGGVKLSFYDKQFDLPAVVAPGIESILSRKRFSISELDADLDYENGKALVHKLVREGLLTLDR